MKCTLCKGKIDVGFYQYTYNPRTKRKSHTHAHCYQAALKSLTIDEIEALKVFVMKKDLRVSGRKLHSDILEFHSNFDFKEVSDHIRKAITVNFI